MSDISKLWSDRGEVVHILDHPIKIRPYDVTSILDEHGNALNPLLKQVQDLIEDKGGGQVSINTGGAIKGLAAQMEALPQMRQMLNALLGRVLIDPKPDDFDLDNFTLVEKLQIFVYVLGGQAALDQAEAFFRGEWGENQNMATVQPSENLREPT